MPSLWPSMFWSVPGNIPHSISAYFNMVFSLSPFVFHCSSLFDTICQFAVCKMASHWLYLHFLHSMQRNFLHSSFEMCNKQSTARNNHFTFQWVIYCFITAAPSGFSPTFCNMWSIASTKHNGVLAFQCVIDHWGMFRTQAFYLVFIMVIYN